MGRYTVNQTHSVKALPQHVDAAVLRLLQERQVQSYTHLLESIDCSYTGLRNSINRLLAAGKIERIQIPGSRRYAWYTLKLPDSSYSC